MPRVPALLHLELQPCPDRTPTSTEILASLLFITLDDVVQVLVRRRSHSQHDDL